MSSLLLQLPAGSVLILGSLLAAVLRGPGRGLVLLGVPVASFFHLLFLHGQPVDALPVWTVFDYSMEPTRLDGLAFVFALAYHFAAFTAALFSSHVRDSMQHVASLMYAGSAIAAVAAGDLITLFVFWELTAVTSVFLIWGTRTERAYHTGMRYLIIQVGSGVLLLSGILFHVAETGSVAFGSLGVESTGGKLIFLAFGIKAAFPLLHSWLQDAYPEATPTGTVWLSAFTTKMAIYALARGYAGEESLVWIGAIMIVMPLIYAVLEDDLRRVLVHGLNNQLGFLVVGVGLGGDLALNGVAGQAAAHIVYKSVLFMCMGAVLYRVGTVKASQLGGLARSMPFTATACIIAGAAGFPMTMAFLGKSLIISAAAKHHHLWTWLVLVFASAGIFYVACLRVTIATFFGKDAGIRTEEAPWNMRAAMGLGAAACVVVGLLPGWFYGQLPYPMEYHAYTVPHVVTQLQLMAWAGLAFAVMYVTGFAPRAAPGTLLDVEVVYRKMLPEVIRAFLGAGGAIWGGVQSTVMGLLGAFLEAVRQRYGPGGMWARDWATSTSAMWVAAILGAILLVYYL